MKHEHHGGGFFSSMLTCKQVADAQFIEIADMEWHNKQRGEMRVWGGSKYIKQKGKGTPGQIGQGGVVIGSVASLTPAGTTVFLQQAKHAQQTWKEILQERRLELLQEFHHLCLENEHLLKAIAVAEANGDGAAAAVVEEGVKGVLLAIQKANTGRVGMCVDSGKALTVCGVTKDSDFWDLFPSVLTSESPQACVVACLDRSSLVPLAVRLCAIEAKLPLGLLTVLTGKHLDLAHVQAAVAADA